MAERLGKPLMPWQRLVADVGGEMVETAGGILVPAYREVVFTTPRQSGKTTLILPVEVQRAIGDWGGPQNIAYTAQTGSDARQKLLNDQAPLLRPHQKVLGIERIYKGSGPFEGVVWHNGSRLFCIASTEDAGHGRTLHLGMRDELMADSDDRRAQALGPAMITVRTAQMWSCSTMGTEESVVWNALVDRGRANAELGKTSGTAYFEWSAPPDSDPDDPETWALCSPALGTTIDVDSLRFERESKTDGEFRRAYLNQRTKNEDRVIASTLWDAVCDPNAVPDGRLVFAVDVNPERSGAAIVAASVGDRPVLEVVEADYPIGGVVARARELAQRWGDPPWVLDASGPANTIRGDLERAGVRVRPYGSRELIDACLGFFDAVTDGTLTVRAHPALDAAVAAATKREVGDAWAWTRKNSAGNISPLVAATLARAEATSTVDVSTQVW